MALNPERFIPHRTLEGGTLIGNSYTLAFAKCPYQWFNEYLRPHPESPNLESGIRSKFRSPFLMAGSTVHAGLAAWYSSGVQGAEDTGRRDIELALTTAKVIHNKSLPLYESEEQAEQDWDMATVLLRTYHDQYGPGSASPEFPELQVLCDGKGEPLVEREFKIPLGYRDFIFTSRPDLICTVRGLLRTRDHKTSHPRFVGERRAWTHWDPEFRGEALCLYTLFPDEPIHGTEANILVKNWTPKSKWRPAERELATHSSTDLLTYRMDVIDVLRQIDIRVELYHEARTRGLEVEEAAREVFPRHGVRTGACVEYRGCPFQALCAHKDRTEEAMRHYVPRQLTERDADQQRPY